MDNLSASFASSSVPTSKPTFLIVSLSVDDEIGEEFVAVATGCDELAATAVEDGFVAGTGLGTEASAALNATVLTVVFQRPISSGAVGFAGIVLRAARATAASALPQVAPAAHADSVATIASDLAAAVAAAVVPAGAESWVSCVYRDVDAGAVDEAGFAAGVVSVGDPVDVAGLVFACVALAPVEEEADVGVDFAEASAASAAIWRTIPL